MADPIIPFDFYGKVVRDASQQHRRDPVLETLNRMRADDVRQSVLDSGRPDEIARLTRVARQAGENPSVVDGSVDQYEKSMQARDVAGLVQRYPAIGKWAATNPTGVGMAADDSKSLGILGSAWDYLKQAPGTAWDFASNIPGRLWNRGLPMLGAGISKTINTALDATDAVTAPIDAGIDAVALSFGQDWLDVDASNRRRREFRQGIAAHWDQVADQGAKTNKGANSVSEGLLQGIDSLPLTALAMLTRNPELASSVVGTQVGASSYQDARTKGLDAPTAARYGILQGGTEALTEKLPMGTLIDMTTRKLPWGKAFLRELGQEMTGEQVATFLQDAADWTYLPGNRNKTVQQFLDERPQAALDTALAVLGGTGTTSAVIGAAHRASDATVSVANRVQQNRQARAERAFLDEAARGADQSKLKQRDPEAFRDLMRAHAEDVGAGSVFIPGEAIRAYNQSEHYEPDSDPFAQSQWQDAAASGGDVVMPIEDFLTDVVGTQAWNAVKDDVRLTQGGMSTREAQTFDDAMDELMGQASEEFARRDRADRAERTTREQLVDRLAAMFSESYTAPIARQYAEIAVQRAQTRAQRLGMELMPQDLGDLTVRQVMPEGLADAVSADRLDLIINAMRTDGPAEYGIGPSLLDFIQQRGGVNDVGGDLASMGVPPKYLRQYDPRQAELTGGLSGNGDYGIDNTLQAAISAGYFPDLVNVENEQGPSTLNTQRLIDAINDELSGKLHHVETRIDEVRRMAEQLRQSLEEAGHAPSTMTDDQIRDVVDTMARDSAMEDGGRSYNQSKSAERSTPITRNADMVLPVTSITSGPVSFEEAKATFASEVKPAKANMVSGEEVVFTQARKAIFSKSDHFNPALRFELIPHLPEIVANAASFATTMTGAQANHTYVHAAAHVRINGRDISVRLVLKDVGDGALRQYQMEGFEVTAAPAGMLRSGDLGTMAPAAADLRSGFNFQSEDLQRQMPERGRTLSDVVADFKGRQLFQEARGRTVFGQSGRIIELFAGRDLSTPIHELGHTWLEELAQDAALPEAPEQLQEDWQAVRDWFAHSGHAIGEDGAIPTEAHELFARGIERYFMEGKAPTNALTRVFENVRQWMLSIYKSVASLRAEISPEIREVFDRMIASDQEIADARERQGIENLFKDAAEAGMSASEFAAYQQKSQDANAAAHAKLLERVMSTIRRRETERYREARKGVRAEEVERIDGSPLYQALAAMDTSKGGNRISKEWIVDRMGLDALELLPRRVPPIYTEGGANPESIAEMSGYSSATEMIEALIGAERAHRQAKEGGDKRSMRERAIENATDEEMNRRYGDPLNDGSIEREATAALQSEQLGEVIASEIRALGRKTGRGPLPYQIARDWARNKVRSSRWTDVASLGALTRHARNAAKAGKAAEAALLAGDHEEAYRQKQFQMLNNAMAAEAYAAADEVEAARKRMDKIAEAKTRATVDQDYLEQAQSLLEAVDLKRQSDVYERRKGSFAAWAAARAAEGFDVVVPESFESTLYQTNWSKMPVNDILMLDEAVKQIMHLGRLKQSLMDGQEEREWESLYQEAADNAANLKGRPPADLAEPGWRNALKGKVLAADAALLKMETVFDWLDGGDSNGVFNRTAFRPVAEAQAREADMLKEYYARIKEHFQAVPKEIAARWNDRITLPFTDVKTERAMVLNRQQLIAMALNVGNDGNLQRLADGYRINQGALVGYLDQTLAKEEWQFVQNIWDTIDTLWPEISAMEKRVNGVAPDKVKARKFDTSTNGQMRGGYYPAIYDASRDYKSEDHAGTSADLLDAKYTKANTRASSTKARDEQVKRPILLNLGVINRHLGEVIHDITHREAVIKANRFLSSEKVRKAVDDALGREIGQQFRPWLKHVANSWAAERAGNEAFGNFMSKARANATMVGLGLRATTMISQVAGYSNSVEVVGEAPMAKAIAAFSAHPIETTRFVMERSGEMRHRMDTRDRNIKEAIDQIARTNPASKVAATVQDGQKFFYHGIGYMDRVVSVPTWMAAYNNALAAGISEADAAYAGDKAVRQSQGADAAKDMAAIQRGTGRYGEALKWLTMFYSYMSAQYQRERTLARDVLGADTRRPRNMPKLAARAFWLGVVPPLLTELIKASVTGGGGPDDDEESWTEWALVKMMSNAIGPIPVARDLFEPLWNKSRGRQAFNPSLSPIQRAYDTITLSFQDVGHLMQGKETKHATKDFLETAGYLTGLVPGQAAATTQFLVDLGSGDADPQSFREWLEGLSTGKIKKK